MSEKLKDHLAKHSIEILKPLLGDEIAELLLHVGQEASTPEVMADLIIMSRGAAAVLKDNAIRQILINNLNDEDVRNLCSLLGIPSAAPRVTLNGVNFDRNNATSTLFQWYGVPYVKDDSSESESSRKLLSREKLGKYQQPAYRKIRSILNNESAKILVHMPYGAGKLRAVMTAVLEAFRSDSEDKTVLWLAPDTCLCEEAFREFETVWNSLGLRDITAYRLFGGREVFPLDSIKNALVVVDTQTFIDAFTAGECGKVDGSDSLISFSNNLRCLILADAGHMARAEIQGIVETMRTLGGKFNIVGISALTGPATDENLPMKIIFDAYDKVVDIDESSPLTALLLNGSVDPISVCLLPSPITETICDDDPISLPDEVAKILASDVNRNKFLLDKLVEISKTEERVIFYATTALQARTFAGLLGLKGTPSSTVTGDMPIERRDQEIAKFENDNLKQVLCAHGTLISALSVKNVTAVLIALPTVSAALLHEMVGRLATDRNNPARPLQVYALCDPLPAYLHLIKNLGHWDSLRS